jgi:hypothetical protein
MGSRNTSFHDGALARVLLAPFKLGFALTLGLAGLLLVAWTVDWLFVAHVWPGRVDGLRALLTEELAMIGTQLLGVRAGILVRFLPLLALLYGVGAAEGLSQRAIRRAQAARESASLYHRAKYGQVVVLALGGSVLLVWPAPVAWGLCAGVGAVLVGALAAGQWAYYKKHV